MISLREIELSAGPVMVEGLDGATLFFDTLTIPITVPCIHGPILKDFELMNGKSAKTLINFCDFRAAYFEGVADDSVITKGLHCVLTPIPGAQPMNMQLWQGGLLPGAVLYKFMLVDAAYMA